MIRGARLFSSLVVALSALAIAPHALAASPDPKAAAEALFGEGRTLFKQGDYADACAKFAESNRLDPAIGTAFNLADCEEHLGHVATSWALWRRVVDSLASRPTDVRAPIARAHVEALAPRLPHVVLAIAPGAPRDTAVRLDGLAIGQGALGAPLPVDPGPHAITIDASGRAAARVEATLREGESRAFTLAPGDAIPSASPEPETPTHRDPVRRTIAAIVAGVGVVGLGVGAYFGAQAASRYADAKRNGSEAGVLDARASGNVSTVAFLAGGALAATGVVLWVTAPSVPTSTARVGIVPSVGAGSASLAFVARFE